MFLEYTSSGSPRVKRLHQVHPGSKDLIRFTQGQKISSGSPRVKRLHQVHPGSKDFIRFTQGQKTSSGSLRVKRLERQKKTDVFETK
jgi:hypothetical protein